VATAASIAGVSFEPLHSLLFDEPSPSVGAEAQQTHRLFTIRAADSDGRRSSARILVNRMYAARGYSNTPLQEGGDLQRITLIGTDHDITRATITIGFDRAARLLADECFADVLDGLRREKVVLCEFIKFAVDGVGRSKRVLASLLHTAFIYAKEIEGCQRIVIEVNPRHVRFYERMLGFVTVAGERRNLRVDALAILMSLDLDFVQRQIGQAQEAKAGRANPKRSLYDCAFSRQEAEGIAGSMRPSAEALSPR
jgi:N-acyl amino acid synthase FeeM